MPTKIDLGMWQQRVGRALDLQGTVSRERKDIIKLYTGTYFGKPTDNTSEISEVNFVYEYIKILIGGIYAQNPHIFVRARTGRYATFAEMMETVINYYWLDLEMKRKTKQTILDGSLQPPGWVEIGYTLLFKQKEEDLYNLERKEQKTEAELGILDDTIKDDQIFANHIPSWNMLWPDGYHNIKDAPYLIKQQEIPLVDLFAIPLFKDSKYDVFSRYAPAEYSKKPSIFRMRDNPQVSNTYGGDLELTKVKLFHIWDKRSKKRFTMANNYTLDTLFERDWNYLIDGFPFYDLSFNEVPQFDTEASSFPMSDIVPMIPQLKELSRISSAMNRHRKRAGTLIFVKKGTMTPVEISNIQSASDLDIVSIDSLDPGQFQGFTPPALPQDFYMIREIVLQDLMRISGFQQLLYSAKGVETATESENVRAGALIRQSEKVDQIEDFTVRVARGLAGLIWQFKQDPRGRQEIADIVGEQQLSEEMWPSLPQDEMEARKIIQRELFFRIDAGSTRPPKDEAVERKQWMDVAGMIKASFPTRIKDDAFLTQLLKKFDFKDLENVVITHDEEEIAAAQKENQLLAKGVPQIVGPNENHLLHLQVHGQLATIPGTQPTQQLDEHILAHSQFLQIQMPKANPQRGDTKPTGQSTIPETSRQGVAENVDIIGGIRGSAGTGGNMGGK